MGHYRSEMGYESEDEAKAKRYKERHKKTMDFIQSQIDKRGIAAVLADFVMDGETSFVISYRK